jgi:hypothetical protein
MARTFIRQDAQIAQSFLYDDTLAAGTTLETATANIEDDLNGLRSQVKRLIWDDGVGNWYDDIPTVNGKKRAVFDLNTDLNDLEEKKFLGRANVLTDITVTAAQNWEILSFAGSETPTLVAAVALTQNGAVVAQSALSAGAFDVHELIEISGPDALNPKNLAVVRSAATGQVIQSSGRDVFALLQYESTGADGGSFNDTSGGNRAKLSFVRPNATFDDLEAVPVGDIAGQTINYNYVFRINFDAFPESAFLSITNFVDQSASADVTRQRAYDNQGSLAVELATNADLDLGASIQWAIRDLANADLLNFTEGSGGGVTTMTVGVDVDTYQNNAVVVDFNSGITVREGGTRPIDLGNNDGVIETTAGDLRVFGFAELYLDDGNQTGSTWAQTSGIKLSDTTAEWDTFETNFGEVSLLNAISQAYSAAASRVKTVAMVTANVPADTDVSGPANDNNLDVDLGDLSTGTFLTDYDIFLNGVLLRNGANAAANHDVYPGTSLANGQLKFEFSLRGGGVKPDQLTVISWA